MSSDKENLVAPGRNGRKSKVTSTEPCPGIMQLWGSQEKVFNAVPPLAQSSWGTRDCFRKSAKVRGVEVLLLRVTTQLVQAGQVDPACAKRQKNNW